MTHEIDESKPPAFHSAAYPPDCEPHALPLRPLQPGPDSAAGQQVAVTHEHAQRVQVHPITQTPESEGAPETVAPQGTTSSLAPRRCSMVPRPSLASGPHSLPLTRYPIQSGSASSTRWRQPSIRVMAERALLPTLTVRCLRPLPITVVSPERMFRSPTRRLRNSGSEPRVK